MKLSVITVVRNRADTIAETLGSVAEQSHRDLEHVVIDGASTDRTLEIFARHAGPSVRIVSEPDHGIYDAMNKGVRLSTGQVIGFLNADDVYAHPRVIADVVAAMQRDGVDVVFGDAGFFRADRPSQPVRRYNSARFNPKRIAWGWMPAHPAMFLRREVFERYGPFRTDYRIAGDFEFIARAFWPGKLRYRHLPEVLVRMRTGGISTGGWRNTILLNREVLRACRENGIPTNMFRILSKYPAKLVEFLQR
jgi:glycosyltransferase involved in cell wall biosynthesis